MLYASDCKRPAVEPVLRNVENICRTSNDFDIFNDEKAKQALGAMVRIIMELYGYTLTGSTEEILDGYSESIKTAAVYTS